MGEVRQGRAMRQNYNNKKLKLKNKEHVYEMAGIRLKTSNRVLSLMVP